MFIEISHSETWFVSSSRGTSFESTTSLKDLILLRSTPFSISSRSFTEDFVVFVYFIIRQSPR